MGALYGLGPTGIPGVLEVGGKILGIKSSVLGAVITSIVGLVGSIFVFFYPKLCGFLMLGAALVGFIFAFLGYLIATIFFLIGGIMALTVKQPNTE